MKTKSLILCTATLLLAGALVGCGQRGPLYMPGEKPAKKSVADPKQKTPTLPKERDLTKPAASAPDKPSAP